MKHVVFALALVAAGCGPATTEQGLVRQTASAWQCHAGDIQVKKIDAHAYRVTGCGRQADYACPVEGSTAGGTRCEIVSGE